MKIKEIKDKDESALRHDLDERRKHLFDLRSQAVTEKLEDPSQLRKTRKDIARIQTVLRQRELAAQQASDKSAAAAKAAAAKKTGTETAAKPSA